MPKVKSLAVDPRETAIKEELGIALTTVGNRRTLAKLTGIEYTKLCKRYHNIGDMRLSELWAIQDVRRKYGV